MLLTNPQPADTATYILVGAYNAKRNHGHYFHLGCDSECSYGFVLQQLS
jgi:hypothetical protein